MSDAPAPAPLSTDPQAPRQRPPSERAVLRKLFLTLFLRGYSARRIQVASAPKSVARKLAGTLLVNVAVGALALVLRQQSLFMQSAYLHGLSMMFLGMFIASSSGEVLFNREEADILMHRPIDPRALLWAKVRVLVEVSLWLAGSLNLIGTIMGATASGWWFVPVHAASTMLQALFCTSCVVLLYQLCLRWFGRERLDGVMTTAQVLLTIAAVLSGQVLPEIIKFFDRQGGVTGPPWWAWALPPVWFAGLDDALAGSGSRASWLLGATGCGLTAVLLWLAFGKLAQDFEAGLQILNENTGRVRAARGQRRLDRMLDLPPLSWWLRDPRERAAFLLVAAYIIRDRDTKLRLYPALAPFLVLPVVFIFREWPNWGEVETAGFGFAFASGYFGMVPLMAVNLLQFSEHWRAADLFHAAPIGGPAPLCHGARKAMLCLLTLPMIVCFSVAAWLIQRDAAGLLLMLPGITLLPLVAIVPNLGGRSVPLSQPIEQARAASRGTMMIAALIVTMFGTMGLSVVAMFAQHFGMLLPLLIVEVIVVAGAYALALRNVSRAPWPPSD